MKNQRLYTAGLEMYLEESKEDEANVNGIIEQIPVFAPQLLDFKDSIKILDIGAGNGRKSLLLGHHFSDLGLEIKLYCVEPRLEQRKKLFRNFFGPGWSYLRRVYDNPLGETDFKTKYDFVLLIHSLYQFPRTENGLVLTLDKAHNALDKNGAGVIIFEHPEGDFRRLKQELHKRFFDVDIPMTEDNITQSLNHYKIPYKNGNKIDFKLCLDNLLKLSDEDLGKKFGFLFSYSLDDEILDNEQYRQVGQWIRGNSIVQGDSRYLDTSDLVIWFYK